MILPELSQIYFDYGLVGTIINLVGMAICAVLIVLLIRDMRNES